MNTEAVAAWEAAKAEFAAAKDEALKAAVSDVEAGLPLSAAARLYGFSDVKLDKLVQR
jgi:hypothetical protein